MTTETKTAQTVTFNWTSDQNNRQHVTGLSQPWNLGTIDAVYSGGWTGALERWGPSFLHIKPGGIHGVYVLPCEVLHHKVFLLVGRDRDGKSFAVFGFQPREGTPGELTITLN